MENRDKMWQESSVEVISGVNLDGLFPFSESLNFEPMVCIVMGVDFC
ncbi:hypothetical protein AB3S75_006210 [Citrus x aurantiifolia]